MMLAQSEMVLIAVWVEKTRLGDFFAGVPEQPSVYHLRCISSDQTVRFRFETGNLVAEANRQCVASGAWFHCATSAKATRSFCEF